MRKVTKTIRSNQTKLQSLTTGSACTNHFDLLLQLHVYVRGLVEATQP